MSTLAKVAKAKTTTLYLGFNVDSDGYDDYTFESKLKYLGNHWDYVVEIKIPKSGKPTKKLTVEFKE